MANKAEWRPKFDLRLSSIVIGLVTIAILGISTELSGAQNAESPSNQTRTAALPVFEVTSVKQNQSSSPDVSFNSAADRMSFSNTPMRMLLHEALDVENDRILGAPDWVRVKKYDIEGKVSDNEIPKMEKLTIDQRRQMLRQLLEDRFGLKFHHENRDIAVYALVVAKGGPKLQKSTGLDPNGAPLSPSLRFSGNARLDSQGTAISFLVEMLYHQLGRSVVDKTGLTGNFDYSLRWTPEKDSASIGPGANEGDDERRSSSDESGPSLFTALNEQLGLRLELRKMPGEVVVIDQLNLPSAD